MSLKIIIISSLRLMNRNMILRQFLEREIPRQNESPQERPKISLKQWLNGSKSSNPQFLKQHILNFFISEGLYDIALQFSKEAGIPMVDIQEKQVKARFKVKKLIQQGKVDQGLQQLALLKLQNRKKNEIQNIMIRNAQNQTSIKKTQEIELQEVKRQKSENQQNSKNSSKNEIIQQQLPQQSDNEVDNRVQNNNSNQKNQQQQPLLPEIFQQEASLNVQQIILQKNNKKQQNNKKSQKLEQNSNQCKIVHQQMNQIFEKGKNKELLFTLNCLKVIELIKQNKIPESIKVAKQSLLPFAKVTKQQNQTLDESRMEKIQKVMSLIAFSNFQESPNYALTTPDFRAKVAHELNTYLLNESNTQAITALVRLTKWCQKRLKKHVDFPELNLSSATLYD